MTLEDVFWMMIVIAVMIRIINVTLEDVFWMAVVIAAMIWIISLFRK